MADMASEGHAEQLAGLGVQPGISTALNPRRETHPEGGMASVSEVTGSLGTMQRPNR